MMATHQSEERKLAAIMFTDMVAFSALTQRNEALALEVLREHHHLLRSIFPQYGGREIKTTGDGFLIMFASALEAARCAIAMQQAIIQHNASAASERRFQVRIGIHVGDVVYREGDVVGDGVNIAERIVNLAGGGGICLSRPVFDQIQNKIPQRVVGLGRPALKNIQAPIEVYRILLPWEQGVLPTASRRLLAPAQRRTWGLAVAVVAALATIGGGGWQYARQAGQGVPVLFPQTTLSAAGVRGDAAKSVAVLPFAMMSPDPADQYLSDGLTEEIIHALGKVTGLRVPSRTSAFFFKGKEENPREIGRQLNVSRILEGSVRKAGNRLRIVVQLINIADGYPLWSETYDRQMSDILDIESDVARQVTEKLQVQLLAQDRQNLARKPAENLEAYDLYLKGRFYYSRLTQDGLRKSLQYYEKAIQKQPDYARAYAGKAESLRKLSTFYAPPRAMMPKAKEAALKALELDPSLPEAHTALGKMLFWYAYDWPSSEREFRHALELDPRYADAYTGLGMNLMARGRLPEAIAKLQRAVQLDPLSATANSALELAFFNSKQYDRAIQHSRDTLELAPNFVFSHAVIGLAYAQKREFPKAIAALQEAARLDRSPTFPLLLAYGYALAGKKDEARKLVHQVEAISKRRYVCYYEIAAPYVALGEKDEAFKWFDKALEQRCDCLVWTNIEPMNDPLRSDPRFTALVRKLGLGSGAMPSTNAGL